MVKYGVTLLRRNSYHPCFLNEITSGYILIVWLFYVCFTDLHYGLQMSVYGFQMDNNEDLNLQTSVS